MDSSWAHEHAHVKTKGLKIKITLILFGAVGLALAMLCGCAESKEPRVLQPVIIHLDFNGADPDLTLQLEEGVFLLPDPPADPAALARLCHARANPKQVELGDGKSWMIVFTGPLLDSPDTVQVRKATLENHVFRMEIAYTNVRLQGAGFRRNQPWRAIVELPLTTGAPPGNYKAEVIWQEVKSLPAGENLGTGRHHELEFKVGG